MAGGDYISHSSDKSDLTSTQSHFQFGADMLAMIGIVEVESVTEIQMIS